MASVLTVNTATSPLDLGSRRSGIAKRPSAEPLTVRAPGPRRGGLGSGVVGDSVCDLKHHGGDYQALYAYAREDLDQSLQGVTFETAERRVVDKLAPDLLDVLAREAGVQQPAPSSAPPESSAVQAGSAEEATPERSCAPGRRSGWRK